MNDEQDDANKRRESENLFLELTQSDGGVIEIIKEIIQEII